MRLLTYFIGNSRHLGIELARGINGINQKMLTQHLRQMELDGISVKVTKTNRSLF